MSDINHIINKSSYIIDHINRNDLQNLFINDDHQCSLFSLDEYLMIYLIFEKVGTSYRNFFMIANYFHELGKLNKTYPGKTSLHSFKNKLAKNNILQDIHSNYVNDCKLDNVEQISTDTSFIPNDNCNEGVGRSAYFKNRNGIKLNNICDQNGFCLALTIDPGNMNDALLGHNIINDNKEMFIGKTLLADSGYDSLKIKNLCDALNCKYIIPTNNRNKNNSELRKIKLEVRKEITEKRKDLMKNEKNERKKHKKYIKRQREKLRKISDRNEIEYINKLIKDNNNTFNEKIDKIQNDRKKLNKDLKNKLAIKIQEFKDKNKKGCLCEYDKIMCPLCETLGICDICSFCKGCNKNMKYYKNMLKTEIILYKRRIKVENNFSHLKCGRIAKVMDRKINMYKNSVYCRLLDLIMNDMNRSKQK